MSKIIHLLVIIFLTIVSQVGGIVYMIVLLAIRKNHKFKYLKRVVLFIVIYLFSTFFIIPKLAPIFGREKIKETDLIHANFFGTILLNRNYVKPELNKVLTKISKDLNTKHKGLKIIYLDANFPFIDKFPLLPHLSHSDGKKIDLSLIYQTKQGKLTNLKPSVTGYGVFENPKEKEINQPKICKMEKYWQYDYPKYLTLGKKNKEIVFSSMGTKLLINMILKQKEIGKLFIEPHLKTRMNLVNSRIRYHGCRAVRHDDHIHIQLR